MLFGPEKRNRREQPLHSETRLHFVSDGSRSGDPIQRQTQNGCVARRRVQQDIRDGYHDISTVHHEGHQPGQLQR